MKTKVSFSSIRFLFISFFAIVLLMSCEQPETDSGAEEALDVNLLKSPDKYADILANREQQSMQTFTIEDVKREGDLLKINVKGGCSASAFKIIWDGAIMLSYPEQVNLVLTHESDQDGCDNTNTFLITVDLSKIFGTHNPSDVIVNIANGSKKEDKSLNPNGSVVSN
jgi:hypothetical protein